ncbi:MAG: hypothetical protein ACOC6J_06600 [Spirochaetota bacterium]
MQFDLKRSAVALVLAAALALLAAGCTVREDVVLGADGSGEASLSVELHPIMIAYMNDLMTAMSGVEGEYPLFDLEQIAVSFAEREEVELTDLDRPKRGALALSIRFTDIRAVFAREDADDILTFERDGANRELTVTLNRDAVQRFLEFAPEENASMAQFLFPPADGSVSREEYREEMAWALEEYDDREAVDRALDNATIEVRVDPAGEIVSQSGGRVEDGVVVFSIPVLELLTLSGDRTYSLVFSP